jgi:hypothetical protein
MQLNEVTMWAIICALVAIPLCYHFWRRWDRPTREAKAEQERRLHERETREAFAREEVKVREHERQQAMVQLQERKKIEAMSPSSAAMSYALSSLEGSEPSEGGVTSEGPIRGVNEVQRSEEEIAILEQIPQSVEVPDIKADESVSDILKDEGPALLKVSISLPEEVKPKATSEELVDYIEWPEWE